MRLTKHHGLGNDFLVFADPDGVHPITEAEAIAVCDRHRGVGADGLLRLAPGLGGADIAMTLLNADGSRAEMSGNGISCLVQAALIAGMARGDRVTVQTDAGLRTVEVVGRPAAGRHLMTVEMGTAVIGDDQPEWIDEQVIHAVRVDVGNPHLVLHAVDPDLRPDTAALGRAANAGIPGGINVEVITLGPGDAEVTMEVYERGVGLTEACGTGAVAAAAAARHWELAPATVTVRQPGGPVTVAVGEPARLTIEVQAIATFEWPYP